MKLLRDLMEALAWHLKDKAKKIFQTPEEILCKEWFEVKGDQSLRLDYPLTDQSLVLDLGGYEGAWAADIYCRYNCPIFIFEPVPAYSASIRNRFKNNPNVKVFEFGLSSTDRNETLNLNGERSSVFSKNSKNLQSIHLKKAADFFEQHQNKNIDLCKINIEGGEYDLLEHLIETNWIDKIKNLQIQ